MFNNNQINQYVKSQGGTQWSWDPINHYVFCKKGCETEDYTGSAEGVFTRTIPQ